MRLGTADVLVRAKTDKFDKDIDKSEKKVKSFGQSSKKELAGLSKSFVSLAGIAGAGALTASLIGLVKVGMKFESQMATVKGIMRASEKDFKLLSNAAKEMGETTEWSATESAKALEFMALAGWSVQKSIEGLPGMLNAATAAGAGLGETSDILTDTLTAMGLEIEDMGRLTDVMVGTTVRANTSFLQMGEALKESAPYAKAYGFEIEEVAALLGVVADAGIKGSDAGTGLKNTWINNAKAAKLLGTEATDLIGTLREANKAQWDTNKFAAVYGRIAGKTVLNIAAQIDKYEALAEKLHDVKGETKKLADIKLDTLAGDFEILKSAVKGVGIAAYENIEGGLRESVQNLTVFISEHKQDFIDFVGTIKEFGEHMLVVGGHVSVLFSNTLTGWNSLPTVIQEIGVVGALVGGKKGKIALIAAIEFLGFYEKQLKKMFPQTVEAYVLKQIKDIEQEVESLEKQLENSNAFVDFWKGAGYSEKAEAKLINYRNELKRLKATLEDTKKPEEVQEDTENKKLEAQMAAYKRFGVMTKAVYAEFKKSYQADYEELLAVTKDKVKAQEWLADKMANLDAQMSKQKKDDADLKAADNKLKAYTDLYKKFGIISKPVYDNLKKTYQTDYDKFFSTTQDKAKAQEWLSKRMAELDIKMYGKPEDTQSVLNAYTDLYNNFGIITQEYYDNQKEKIQADYKKFVDITKDKETAQEWLAGRMAELNAKMFGDPEKEKDALAEKEQAYMNLYNDFGILTQESYNQIYKQYVKDRDNFVALTGDKELAHKIFAERLLELNAEMEKGDKTWQEHAVDGLEDYAKNAGDINEQIGEVFVNTFKSMEDAIVDFCMTGEENFGKFAEAVISDMIRIAVRSQITGPLAEGLSTTGQWISKGVSLGINYFIGGGAASSGAASSGGGGLASSTFFVAQGGVFTSPGLSAHSNTVVDTPTLFSFAQGAGIFGEAGPEAVMPLTRLPGGDLGVKSEPAASNTNPMEIHIHEAPGTSVRTEQSEDGTKLSIIIEQVEQAMAGRMGRGTGLAPFMDNRYSRAF